MTRTAIAVYRTSTEEQSLGIEAQRHSIALWAAANDVLILDSYEEHISGATPIAERPTLRQAITRLRQTKANLLVFQKRDRVARDIVISRQIEKLVQQQGAALHVVESSANGQTADDAMMRGLEDLFAERERAKISERTKQALSQLRRNGKRLGNVRFGYKDDGAGNEVPDPNERKVIELVTELSRSGERVCDIVRALRPYRNRQGRPYSRISVVRIMQSKCLG